MKNLIVSLILCCASSQLWAAEATLENIKVDTDLPAISRGVDDLMNNCHSCHTLKYVTYIDLLKLGIDKQKIDGWRGEQPMDSPLTSLMSDESALQAFNLVPPDLSLMTKARDGGANYVYSYLLGYYNTPDGVTHNRIYPATHMPDPLGISTVTDHAQRIEITKTAHDIVSFLSWAADPHEQERHRLGYYVIGYLLILTLMLYFVKKQIWSRLK
jgi:ubiquinol-cytochrome c reductase cytochrome c1 subunit